MSIDEIATEWARQSMAQIAAWDGKGKSPLHPCKELAKACESHHNDAGQAKR